MSPPSRRAHVEEQTVQIRLVGRSTEVPLWREQMEDEGLTVVILAMESGRKPDERVMARKSMPLEVKGASMVGLRNTKDDTSNRSEKCDMTSW